MRQWYNTSIGLTDLVEFPLLFHLSYELPAFYLLFPSRGQLQPLLPASPLGPLPSSEVNDTRSRDRLTNDPGMVASRASCPRSPRRIGRRQQTLVTVTYSIERSVGFRDRCLSSTLLTTITMSQLPSSIEAVTVPHVNLNASWSTSLH